MDCSVYARPRACVRARWSNNAHSSSRARIAIKQPLWCVGVRACVCAAVAFAAACEIRSAHKQIDHKWFARAVAAVHFFACSLCGAIDDDDHPDRTSAIGPLTRWRGEGREAQVQ